MKVYRSISLAPDARINTDNIGRSWSLCEIYAEHHVKQAGCNSYVILAADIDESQIEVANTLYAHDTRPREFEVVLTHDTEIEAIIHFSKHDGYEQYDNVTGNAGDNFFEDYLSYSSPYEGTTTMTNIIELAETFA